MVGEQKVGQKPATVHGGGRALFILPGKQAGIEKGPLLLMSYV